jgi:hypothetical protein
MLPLNYDILDYQSIEILCFRYNESAGISFLLQQCIALDDLSEGHSDYWAVRLLSFRTIGTSDYWAFWLFGGQRKSILENWNLIPGAFWCIIVDGRIVSGIWYWQLKKVDNGINILTFFVNIHFSMSFTTVIKKVIQQYMHRNAPGVSFLISRIFISDCFKFGGEMKATNTQGHCKG